MEKLKNSFLCILIFYTVLFQSLKHDLKITNDYRKIFYIETFGFEKGGVIEMNIYNFKVFYFIFSKKNFYFFRLAKILLKKNMLEKLVLLLKNQILILLILWEIIYQIMILIKERNV